VNVVDYRLRRGRAAEPADDVDLITTTSGQEMT
jgi:hypothetical protein